MTEFETKLLEVLGEIRTALNGISTSVQDEVGEVVNGLTDVYHGLRKIAGEGDE